MQKHEQLRLDLSSYSTRFFFQQENSFSFGKEKSRVDEIEQLHGSPLNRKSDESRYVLQSARFSFSVDIRVVSLLRYHYQVPLHLIKDIDDF